MGHHRVFLDHLVARVCSSRMQGSRPIYEFTYNGTRQRVAITVSNNGYIVGANPRSLPKED